MALSNKKLASNIVKEIRELNSRMASDQYRMAKLLFTLHTGSLHLEFGYDNFAEFCDEELPWGYNTALANVSMFRDIKRLKYNQKEAIEILSRLGLSRTRTSLRRMENKATPASLEKLFKVSATTFTVHMPSFTDMQRIEKKLLKHGLDVATNGRRLNMSETVRIALLAS